MMSIYYKVTITISHFYLQNMEIIVAEIVVSSPRKRFVIGFALKQTVLVP